MPEHPPAARAIFLSYAHEDAEPVRRIADALRAAEVEVWFDKHELRGGDAWDQKIRTQIRTCALCLPVISATTQRRGEGYFRREWRLAAERTRDMAAGVPFLVPVVIDETLESEALVPDEFMGFQWTRLPGGLPTPAFVAQVKRQLERRPGPASRSRSPHTPAPSPTPAPRSSRAVGIVALVAVVAAAALAWHWARRPADADGGAAAETAARPAAAFTRDKSIAVLPFNNLSDDKDSAFFADGVHEDILTNLSLIRELRVVSRTTVATYRDSSKTAKQIAQELGVTYILEGSVRRAGSKVRVTGQLIHAATDEHLWAQSYDRNITDVFAIQSELSQQIAAALKTVLSPEEKALLARRPTVEPAAYDLFLRARELDNRGGATPANFARKVELFEQAVKLDPAFAQAWGELASDLAYWTFSDWEGAAERLVRAKEAIERAMALAPDDPEVFSSLGTYYYYGYRDYERATEQYYRRAQLQPNSPVVFNALGLILRRQGKWAEALVHARRACALDPANVNYHRNLLGSLRAGRRWDEAIATQRRIVALLDNDPWEQLELGYVQFQATGSKREGEAFIAGMSPALRDSPRGINLRLLWAQYVGDYAAAARLDREQPYYDADGAPRWQQAAFAAYCLFALGDVSAARARLGDFPEQLREKLKTEPRHATYWSMLGIMEAIRGNRAEAMRCADRSVELMPLSRDALDGATLAAYRTVLTYDLVGEREQVLTDLAKLLRVPHVALINVHELRTLLLSVREDPRFEALLADPKNNAPLF